MQNVFHFSHPLHAPLVFPSIARDATPPWRVLPCVATPSFAMLTVGEYQFQSCNEQSNCIQDAETEKFGSYQYQY